MCGAALPYILKLLTIWMTCKLGDLALQEDFYFFLFLLIRFVCRPSHHVAMLLRHAFHRLEPVVTPLLNSITATALRLNCTSLTEQIFVYFVVLPAFWNSIPPKSSHNAAAFRKKMALFANSKTG